MVPLLRATAILLKVAPLLLSFRRDRHRWLLWGAPLARSPAEHQRRANRLAATIAGLGPTFVKLAQLFAGRSDIIPSPYVEALGTLTDRVPPVAWRRIRAALEAAYGEPPERYFEQISAEPLAAASLGQVHRARIDGRDVVVKVLRPGVGDTVSRDIAAARRLLDWVAPRLNPPHVRGLRSVLDEFEHRVADELDFRQEARYAQRVRANFAAFPALRVPEVLPAHVRRTALVLEYIEGRRIDRIDDWLAAGTVQSDRVLRTVMELYVQMMLIDGLFHADPHPGNLLVDAQGRVVLLDFGMVVDVPVETRRVLVRTVFSAIRGDVKGTVDGFYGLGLVTPDADRATIEQLATQLIALSTERTTARERIDRAMKLADEVMSTLYDFPVVLPGEMVYFARTAALIEGLGVRWDPRFNAIGFASPIVLRLRGRIINSLGGLGAMAGESVDWPVLVGETLGAAVAVARRAVRRVLGALPRAATTAALVALASLGVGAQPTVAGGHVIGAADGRPVPWAIVTSLSSGASTLSSADGAFSVRLPAAGTDTVRIRRIGFRPQVVAISSGTPVVVRLQETSSILTRVEVTGMQFRVCEGARRDAGSVLDDHIGKLAEQFERSALLERDLAPRTEVSITVQRFNGDGDRTDSITATTIFPDSLLLSYANGQVLRHIDDAQFVVFPTTKDFISRAFLRTHCFAPSGDTGGDSTAVQIDFQPTARAIWPTVRGTITLDRASGLPRAIAMHLVGLRSTDAVREGTAMIMYGIQESAYALPLETHITLRYLPPWHGDVHRQQSVTSVRYPPIPATREP